MLRQERPPSRAGAWVLALFFFLFTAALLLAFLAPWRTELASREGRGIDGVILYVAVVSAVIVVAGHAALGAFVLRGGGGGYRRPSARAEWAWSLAPVALMVALAEVGVLVLGAPVWAQLYTDPAEDAIELEAVGKQFEWIFRYPGKDGKFGRFDPKLIHDTQNPLGLDEDDPAAIDDIVVRGVLHLPVGRDAVIRLRTQDVLHSFFVPQFRVKQDLISGFPTRTKFRPTREGKYELACAELCGLGHYKMRAFVQVESQQAFDAWLAKQIGQFE
jgi:cytochrome c oxidase subunit 2